jgi:manganese transport protein
VLKIFAWLSALIIVSLNIKLVIETLAAWRVSLALHEWVFNFLIFPLVLFAGLLLLYIIGTAIFSKRFLREGTTPHGKAVEIPFIEPKVYSNIAICIDFSTSDIRALTEGISHGNKLTKFYLLHVVETAGARTMGAQIQDYETHEDWKQLHVYGDKLRLQGYQVKEKLGFGNPKKEIPHLTQEVNAELLVIGGHGHRGIRDFIYGETISAVRHSVSCPVLAV